MRLYEEIFKGVDGVGLARCLIIPSGEGYFEGVKYVEDFSPEKVVICFSKNRVEIEGEALSIAKYCEGDLHLSGKILSLKTENGKGDAR